MFNYLNKKNLYTFGAFGAFTTVVLSSLYFYNQILTCNKNVSIISKKIHKNKFIEINDPNDNDLLKDVAKTIIKKVDNDDSLVSIVNAKSQLVAGNEYKLEVITTKSGETTKKLHFLYRDWVKNDKEKYVILD